MPFSNVVLLPDQLALVQRVFKDIAGEPWFDRNQDNEQAFASVILREFQHGTTDESDLALFSRTIAQRRFSINGLARDREWRLLSFAAEFARLPRSRLLDWCSSAL